MEQRKELHAFVEACKKEGLNFPRLLRAASEMAYFWEFTKNSNALNLHASLFGSFEYSFPEELDISDIMAGELYDFTATILYSSIYNTDENGKETKPEEWVMLPKRYRDECKLIAKLDKHIPGAEKHKAAQNPMSGAYDRWCEFYSALVRQKKLRWAVIAEETFPYVITASENLEKKAVAFHGELYFVSEDIAKNPWQQQISAYYARNCQAVGHEFALQKEKELIRKTGMEEAYKRWKAEIEK